MSELLTRDQFREGVFRRDGYNCVFKCQTPGSYKLDAHHIIERRLWPDGGYYLDNGATVCEDCHLKCEQTIDGYSVEDVRRAAGITKIIVPPHLYPDELYDKWANPIMPNGQRMRGELFEDVSVQKVLAPVMHLFTSYVKFPRTVHLPNSPGIHSDDRILESIYDLTACPQLVMTEKLDGENTTMYRDYIHARSVSQMMHPSQGWVKNYWAKIAHEIPEGWRICGENLFAKHSIYYPNLKSYFYGFSIWNEKNECLPWDETLEYFGVLGIEPVPVIRTFPGQHLMGNIEHAATEIERHNNTPGLYGGHFIEGFVVRSAVAFSYRQYKTHVAKWVRKGHVQSTHNWRNAWNGEKNGLI